MGRLKGFLIGTLMVFQIVVVETIGHRIDTIYSYFTPEIIGVITLAALLGSSYVLKADRIALLTVFVLTIIYGIIAFFTKLDFYYHDYPQRLADFVLTIIIRATFYSLPVLIGYKIVSVRATRL